MLLSVGQTEARSSFGGGLPPPTPMVYLANESSPGFRVEEILVELLDPERFETALNRVDEKAASGCIGVSGRHHDLAPYEA